MGGILRVLRGRGVRGLLLVALLGWAFLHALSWLGGPQAVREQYGMGAAAFLVPVQAVVAVSPAPGEIVALGVVAIYGFRLGALLIWAGWLLAALLEYALFRRIAADAGSQALAARTPRWLRRFPASHPAFLGLTRLLPFGNHVVNAVAGSAGVPLWRFCWPSALALVPGSLLFAALASGVVRL
jgi:uncharacterized membrane protein YdjX (TVP38/TMEM64 family)